MAKTIAYVAPFPHGSAWIERGLRNVVSKVRTADEVIIVDEGSRDDEHSALLEFGAIKNA